MLRRAAGNPLALVELARVAPETVAEEADDLERADPHRTGLRRRPAEPAAPHPYGPAPGRRGRGGPRRARALPGTRPVADALEPAEEVGLVSVRGSRVSFRHPLARQAVYAAATAAERARAHRALADAYPSEADRRAWHRAVSVTAPDESVADELAARAARAVDRVAYAEAARALRRAVELTPDPAVRERRMVQLLQVGVPIGEFAAQIGLARRVRDETKDPEVRAGAQHFIATALTQTMDLEAARLALEDSVAQSAVVDPVAAWASLTSLAVLIYQTAGDARLLTEWVRRLGRHDPEDALVTASRVWSRAAAEPAGRPADLLDEVRGARPLPPGTPPVVVGLRAMMFGAAAWLLDLPELAAAQLREARAILDRPSSWELVPVLVALAQVHADRVALDDADEAARILFEIAEAQDLEYQRAVAQHTRAAVAALRGDRDGARRIADDVLGRLDLASCVALEVGVRTAVADSWFGEDDLIRYQHLRSAFVARRPPPAPPALRTGARPGRCRRRCGAACADDGRTLLAGVEAALPDNPGTVPDDGDHPRPRAAGRRRRDRPAVPPGGRRPGARPVGVRAGQRAARLRPLAAPAPACPRGASPARLRAADLRTARDPAVGRRHQDRAAAGRRRPRQRHGRLGLAHRPGAPCRPAGRPRPHEPARSASRSSSRPGPSACTSTTPSPSSVSRPDGSSRGSSAGWTGRDGLTPPHGRSSGAW